MLTKRRVATTLETLCMPWYTGIICLPGYLVLSSREQALCPTQCSWLRAWSSDATLIRYSPVWPCLYQSLLHRRNSPMPSGSTQDSLLCSARSCLTPPIRYLWLSLHIPSHLWRLRWCLQILSSLTRAQLPQISLHLWSRQILHPLARSLLVRLQLLYTIPLAKGSLWFAWMCNRHDERWLNWYSVTLLIVTLVWNYGFE